MIIAREKEIGQLKLEYGFEVDPELACFHNALRAAFLIFARDRQEFPRVWQVNFKNSGDAHAYLVFRGRAYSNGVTCQNGQYPDYDIEELRRVGIDVTLDVLEKTVDAITGGEDNLGFGLLLRSLPFESQESDIILIEAVLNTCGYTPDDLPMLLDELEKTEIAV